MKRSQAVFACDFCMKSQHDVAHIVVGVPPRFPAACGECIGVLVSALPKPVQLPALASVDSNEALSEQLGRISKNLNDSSARASEVSTRLQQMAMGVSEELG